MPTNRKENILLSMVPLHRAMISLVLSLIVFLLIRQFHFNWMMNGMILWDVFALSYIIICWFVFFTSSINHITKRAQSDDGSSVYVFFIVVLSSFASMITVALLIITKEVGDTTKEIYLPVIIVGMMLSWTMVHTTFCFHYARLYYNEYHRKSQDVSGLSFPEEQHPDYLDFAYFSFIIGMTFQVSDVEINSKTIRRLALAHSLLSFVLNTFVVALTINLIAGLKG